MTLPEMFADLLQVLSLPSAASAPDFAQARVLVEMNAVIQQMADCGEDFYGRETLTVDLASGTSAYELEKEVQSVLNDGVRLDDGTMLRRLITRGQFRQFGQLFLGQLNNTVPTGTPQAWFLESLKDTDAEDGAEDSVKMTLHVLPAPSLSVAADLALEVDVIKEPVLLVAADVADESDTKLPIPHKYVESIFLPLARYNLTNYFLFTDEGKLARLKEDNERALNLLGMADPRKGAKPAESNANALRGRAEPAAQPKEEQAA